MLIVTEGSGGLFRSGFEDAERECCGDCLFECIRGTAVVGAADPPGLDVGGVVRSIAWWIRLMCLSVFFTPSWSSPLGASFVRGDHSFSDVPLVGVSFVGDRLSSRAAGRAPSSN